jgi:polysaccharide biosynthesis transport protein
MYQNQSIPPSAELGFFDLALMLWRRKWLLLVLPLLAAGIAQILTTRLKPRWKATAQMVVVQRGATTTSTSPESAYSAPLVENAETQVQMIESAGMVPRTLALLKNKAYTEKKTLRDLGIVNEEDIALQFADNLTVKVPIDTNLLVVTTTGPTGEQAVLFANAVCQAFVQWKKDIAQANVRDIAASLQTRASRAREQMLEAEQAETAFKKQNHLVDVPAQYKATLERYTNQEAEIATLQRDAASQESHLNALGAQLALTDKSIRDGDGVRDDMQVQTLQRQLNDLQVERASAALKFTPEYPGVLPDMDAKIQDVKNRLTLAVQGTLNNKMPSLQAQGDLSQAYQKERLDLIFTRAKLAGNVAQRDALKRDLAGVPDSGMQYARLTRNAELARQLHSSLQASLNAVRVSNDLVSGNVQVSSEALLPNLPFSPIRSRNLLLGGMLGLGTALLLSFLLENSDHRLRSLGQVRRLVSGPVIGMLPQMSHRDAHALETGGAPAAALEAYSLARANLAMVARESLKSLPWTKQVILVTSAVPAEGKSLTAAYMARSLARAGKRVILIDADMRRPAQNRLFNTSESIGLADVLIGQVPLEDALVRSDTDNLYLLHSGQPSRNPTELISLPQMGQLLTTLRETADIIVVDTPACVAVADALLLAPQADCIVQVIGLGKVDEEMLLETTSALRAAAPQDLVYFVNRVARQARHGYTKYYNYNARVRKAQERLPANSEALTPPARKDNANI